MPEGTTTVKSGKFGPYNQVKREAETRYFLSPEGEASRVVVDVTTHHDPDSKVFRSTITWGTLETRPLHEADGSGSYTVYSWSSDHAYVVLGRTPVARYSVKALEAEHARILAALAARPSYVEHVFAEAAEAVGLEVAV